MYVLGLLFITKVMEIKTPAQVKTRNKKSSLTVPSHALFAIFKWTTSIWFIAAPIWKQNGKNWMTLSLCYRFHALLWPSYAGRQPQHYTHTEKPPMTSDFQVQKSLWKHPPPPPHDVRNATDQAENWLQLLSWLLFFVSVLKTNINFPFNKNLTQICIPSSLCYH